MNSSGMRYIPFSNLGHLLSSGGPPDLEYLLRAASIDGASVDHTESSWSPITHFPVVVRQINIKENPDVSCYQPRGQGHVKDGSDAILDCCVLRFVELTARHTIRAPGTSNVLRGHPRSCQKLVVVAGAELQLHLVNPHPDWRCRRCKQRSGPQNYTQPAHQPAHSPQLWIVLASLRVNQKDLVGLPFPIQSQLCPGL